MPDDTPVETRLWAPNALLPDGWANDVLLSVDAHGNLSAVEVDSPPDNALRLPGPALPGVPNVHSHAHQRAMAGLGERAGGGQDSFWTWRKVMYGYLERIEPDHLRRIAAQLYLEMLKHGYTAVGEFQYLHHDPAGRPYDNRAEMTLQCLQAARESGIGFTALPVLYEFGGFGGQSANPGQRRFLNDRDGFCEIMAELQSALGRDPQASLGMAPHSLRAVTRESLAGTMKALGREHLAAIHIHIAEQEKEVADCLAWSGRRPVDWLYDQFDVDAQWCLVHATHMTAEETARVACSGAVAGLCPTTEANLGDGFFNAMDYAADEGAWAVGSDSHISISPVEELRWLEYGVRLTHRRRNMTATEATPSTGRALFDAALAGGARACGRKIGRIETGCRADLVILDADSPRLFGRHGDSLLDSWIFSGNDNPVRDVYVGGRRVVENGRHHREEIIAEDYRSALEELGEQPA